MRRVGWNRIGLAAAVLLVPGGFVLGAVLLARQAQAAKTAARTQPHDRPSALDAGEEK